MGMHLMGMHLIGMPWRLSDFSIWVPYTPTVAVLKSLGALAPMRQLTVRQSIWEVLRGAV
jgi:hypothetical protein